MGLFSRSERQVEDEFDLHDWMDGWTSSPRTDWVTQISRGIVHGLHGMAATSTASFTTTTIRHPLIEDEKYERFERPSLNPFFSGVYIISSIVALQDVYLDTSHHGDPTHRPSYIPSPGWPAPAPPCPLHSGKHNANDGAPVHAMYAFPILMISVRSVGRVGSVESLVHLESRLERRDDGGEEDPEPTRRDVDQSVSLLGELPDEAKSEFKN
jgi:hypothetical protein